MRSITSIRKSRYVGRIGPPIPRLGLTPPLTVPHYFDFGRHAKAIGRRLDQPDAWDAVRDLDGDFGLPETRSDWEERSRNPTLVARARDIAAVVKQLDAARVCSYGVGAASLELALARELPGVALTCTEFAPRTVRRLRRLFEGASVIEHDLRSGRPLDADLHLMHRVDLELTNDEWRRVLARFEAPVLFVPSGILDLRGIARELLVLSRHPRTATRAGVLRNEPALRSLWKTTHVDERVRVGDIAGFLLRRRS